MTPVVALLPDEELRRAVGPVADVELLVEAEVAGREADVEVLVARYLTTPAAVDGVESLPGLRFVQLQTAGYDRIPERLPGGVELATARGVHDDATAELAVGLVVASLRGIDDAVRAQSQQRWQPMPGRRSLADSRVLVLGYGSIGRLLTRRLHELDAAVIGVASRAREDWRVGTVHTIDELPDLLPRVDVVICLLPHSPATHHLVDDGFLSLLRDGALVVNVGRGPVVDTAAVLTHAGRLRFALDVTDPEPLPDGHPLWSAPGVLITPHIAGGTTAMLPRMAALVCDQLTAYAAGRPLRNLV